MNTFNEEQIQEMYRIRDKILDKIFALNFFDAKKTDIFIDVLYKVANVAPPIKVYLDSPKELQMAGNMLLKFPETDDPTEILKKIRAKEFPYTRTEKLEYIPFCYRGTWWDLDWVLFYKYFSGKGVDVPPLFMEYAEKFLEALPAFLVTFTPICLISLPPILISLDPQKRLHSNIKPAVTFRDDYQQYWVHGIAFTEDEFNKFILLEPKWDEVMTISNVEKRTTILTEHKNLFINSGAKLIAQDKEYSKINKQELDRYLYEAKYENISFHIVRLHDHSVDKESIHLVPLTCKTPEEAVLWMNHGHKDFITQT